MSTRERPKAPLARSTRRLGHLDLAGAGQVCAAGSHAYVGHIPSPSQLGTSFVAISDPRSPRAVATITLDHPQSHSHKARVVAHLLIGNHQRTSSKIRRAARQLAA